MKDDFSVPGYNILDMYGNVLHNGDIVRMYWGGGNDNGQRYRTYAYHRLTITKRGKLKLDDLGNIVNPRELSFQKWSPREDDDLKLGDRLKEYY